VISRIDLELFKCFKLLKLPLEPLTLLTGANASGKSTVLQALVLLHQTILNHEWSNRIQLNGTELELGTATDIVDKTYGRRQFGIAIIDNNCSVQWKFNYGDDKMSMSAPVETVDVNGQTTENPKKLRFLLPETLTPPEENLAQRLRSLTYLTAERVGPRDGYQLQDPIATQVVGPRGENAIGLLYQRRDAEVLSPLVLESAPPTLLKQVGERMKTFFPGTSLIVQLVPQTNIVTLGLRTSDATDFHRPINVGFGLTQILPIIIAALAAPSESLLLIENPEVHLHPAGQARMGEFLAEVAAAGIQVLLESHSDHILNGIRRAVKTGKMQADKVALHFFKPRHEEDELNPQEEKLVQVISPTLDSSGNIDHWPEGFFDQFDKDLNYFAGWGE
jgi:predicted ATPase